MKFSEFLTDMGDRPVGMTLDRINPNGNYEPSNCRWATAIEQARNRRPARSNPSSFKRRLSDEQIAEIRRLDGEMVGRGYLSRRFRISGTYLKKICGGEVRRA